MKRYIKSAKYFQHPLMEYIPKFYKPYVSNIYRDEADKQWNDVTQRWNVPVVVEWTVEDETEEQTFANAAHMHTLLKEFGADVIDSMLYRHGIL